MNAVGLFYCSGQDALNEILEVIRFHLCYFRLRGYATYILEKPLMEHFTNRTT